MRHLDVSVLQHRDLSAQNWLVDGASLTGLVDWEIAEPAGIPGIDILHAAVSVFEHGVGARSWSDANIAACFDKAWSQAGLFEGARAAVASTAAAAGVDGRFQESLTLAFFARRLGRQRAGLRHYGIGTATLATIVNTVCNT
jgi:hypothetical protein